MTDVPIQIRRFETLQLASITTGLVHSFVATDGGALDAMITAILMVWLTMLVSRRRKNWAKWLLVGLFMLGGLLMLANMQIMLSSGYLAITIAVTLIQAVAIGLLFVGPSSAWLTGRSVSA